MAADTGQIEREARRASAMPPDRLRRLPGFLFGWLGKFWMRHGDMLGTFFFAGFIAVVMVVGYLRPVHSWDMIAYLASSMNGAFDSPAALHSHVWDSVRSGTTPERFAALSEGDSFRLRQFTDPEAFRSMLPMFEVKWLYVKLVGLLSPLTGPLNAGYVINVASAVLFAGTVSWWLLRTGLAYLAPLVAAFLMISGFPAMAMAETPDLLCTALVTSSILLFDRDKVAAGSTALVFAVGVRPDMAAFAGVLLAASWLWSHRRWPMTGVTFLVSVGVYLTVSKLAHHPGWWPHLYFSTYQFQETLVDFHPAFSPVVYGVAFAWNVIRSAFENSWLGIYAMLLAAWALTHAAGLRMTTSRHVLVAAALAAVAAKFIVFPLHDGRVYVPLLIPAAMLLMAGFRDGVKGAQLRIPGQTRKA